MRRLAPTTPARGWRRAALAAALALSAPACAHISPRPGAEAGRIVWPPPPAPARIAFVQSFGEPREFGIRRSWLSRVARYLSGAQSPTGMNRPHGVAVAPDGAVIVADPDGALVHVYDAARSRYLRLHRAGEQSLVSPVGVAVDGEGRIFVSDSYLRTIFRFDRDGRWVDAMDGDGALQRPAGLAYDRGADLLWVADAGAHRVVALDADGRQAAAIGRRGSGPGEFNFPVAVAVTPDRRIFVTDSLNHRLQVFTADGAFIRTFGEPGTAPGAFDKVKGVALDSDGHVYVVDAMKDAIQVFDEEGRLLTVVGGPGAGPAQFSLPSGICIDGQDRILVADSANRRVQVLQYLPSGMN